MWGAADRSDDCELVGGRRERRAPIELRRHLETKKQGRQLQVINGSVYYRVTYRVSRIRRTTIQEHSQRYCALPRG